MECNYKEVAPAKADKAHNDLMDQIRVLQNQNRNLQEQVEKVLTCVNGQGPSKYSNLEDTKDFSRKRNQIGPVSPPEKKYLGSFSDQQVPMDARERERTSNYTEAGFRTINPNASVDIKHSTAAQRLLDWESIKRLFDERFPVPNENYVMDLENQNGLIRVFGRGHGSDGLEGLIAPPSPSISSASGSSDDVIRSPNYWGTGFGPPPHNAPRTVAHEHPGGLNQDGSLKIDKSTMDRLLRSYMDNFHIMHPFIDEATLRRMFDKFSTRYNRPSSVLSPFVPPPGIGQKRKHSNSYQHGNPNEMSPDSGSQAFERNCLTAIVLLVMALGKMGEHTEPLPGPIPDNSKDLYAMPVRSYSQSPSYPGDSPSVRPYPSSSQTSPQTSVTSPAGNPRYPSTMSRKPSTEESGTPPVGFTLESNADVIPGLAYYARATSILGNLHGGRDICHVQANLLAGLYVGQLARSVESHAWINAASMACLSLVAE